MAFKFFSRINTILFVIPVLFVLAVYLGIGLWVYVWGAADLIGDFHSAQLVTMLSDKKNGVELWFDIRRKAIEEIAASPVIAGDIRALAEKHSSAVEDAEVNAAAAAESDKAAMQSMQRITKYLAGFGHFKSISFMTGDGRLIWTAGRDLPGGDSPLGNIVAKIPQTRTSVFPARINAKEDKAEILISAPVALNDKDMKLMVIGQLNPADLASSLIVEKGFYETGRVAVIDDLGVTLASRDMTDAGNIRYDVPRGAGDGVGYRDGIFYVVSPLKFEGLRLIAMLDAAEASKPLKPFLNLYFLFAGIILLVAIMQGLVLAPRIIKRPFKRLLKATESLATGDLRAINLKKGFHGELKELSEGFSAMIVGLGRRKPAFGKTLPDTGPERSKTMMAHVLAVEVRGRLEVIRKTLEAHAAECQCEDRDTVEAAAEIKRMTETIEAFNLLTRLRDGSFKPVPKKLDLRAIFVEAEKECRELVGNKEIELILDGHNKLLDRALISDDKSLKALIAALMRHAVRMTEVGTITLLASYEMREGAEYLELTLSDTGCGMDRQTVEWTKKEGLFPSHRADFGMAREFTELFGGSLSIESLQDRGSIVTVLLPLNEKQETEAKNNAGALPQASDN
jgi:signal transduction histidine kinase